MILYLTNHQPFLTCRLSHPLPKKVGIIPKEEDWGLLLYACRALETLTIEIFVKHGWRFSNKLNFWGTSFYLLSYLLGCFDIQCTCVKTDLNGAKGSGKGTAWNLECFFAALPPPSSPLATTTSSPGFIWTHVTPCCHCHRRLLRNTSAISSSHGSAPLLLRLGYPPGSSHPHYRKQRFIRRYQRI
jgi:hypothetical protein